MSNFQILKKLLLVLRKNGRKDPLIFSKVFYAKIYGYHTTSINSNSIYKINIMVINLNTL